MNNAPVVVGGNPNNIAANKEEQQLWTTTKHFFGDSPPLPQKASKPASQLASKEFESLYLIQNIKLLLY